MDTNALTPGSHYAIRMKRKVGGPVLRAELMKKLKRLLFLHLCFVIFYYYLLVFIAKFNTIGINGFNNDISNFFSFLKKISHFALRIFNDR